MIIDRCRNKKEFKRLYKERPMPNQYNLGFLLNNPNLFCFYGEDDGLLKGYITVQVENGLLTLSGASVPKNMSDNIKAIMTVCDAFNEDIYAITGLKHAGYVLKKAGFVKVDDNKYVRYRNGQ